MNSVEEYFNKHNIEYKKHEHPPVYTCEEAEKHCGNIPGVASKNLLLRDEKKKRYFLVILPDYKQADLKQLTKTFGISKIMFAKPENVKEKLGVKPGAVSPFGLINDTEAGIEVYVDKDINDSDIVSFHPNTNTATLELTQEMFQKYLDSLDHKIEVIEL